MRKPDSLPRGEVRALKRGERRGRGGQRTPPGHVLSASGKIKLKGLIVKRVRPSGSARVLTLKGWDGQALVRFRETQLCSAPGGIPRPGSMTHGDEGAWLGKGVSRRGAGP